MKFKKAKYIKEDFSKTTEQGYEVVEIATSKSGRKYAIIHRPKVDDYLIAAGYNTDRGDWAQGYYDYKTLEDARDRLDYAMERAGDTRYTAMREGMKDALDRMIGKKEEALTESTDLSAMERDAITLDNMLWDFLEKYYTRENEEFFTPDDKLSILGARGVLQALADPKSYHRRRPELLRRKRETDAKREAGPKRELRRIDTRKLAILGKGDDYGFDEYDEVEINEGKEAEIYIYEFPKFTDDDRSQARKFGLEVIRDTDTDTIVKGTKGRIEDFADSYLGYELVPDYLYKEDEYEA